MSNVIKINNVTITTSSSSNNVSRKIMQHNNVKITQNNNDLPVNVFIENVNNRIAILHVHGRLTYAYMQKLLRHLEQNVIPTLNHDMIAICTNLSPYFLQQITLLLRNYNYDVGYYDSSTSTMYFKHFSLMYASNYDEVRNDE